jgi:hypothetical protein
MFLEILKTANDFARGYPNINGYGSNDCYPADQSGRAV